MPRVMVIISWGGQLTVSRDAPPVSELSAFVVGLSTTPALVAHDGVQDCVELCLTPLGAYRPLGEHPSKTGGGARTYGPGMPEPHSLPPAPEPVRAAGMSEVAELACLMARAFQDDPVTRWILPDDDLRRRSLPAVYGMQMRTWYLPWGKTDAVVHDARLAAAALWSPPDRPHPSLAVQLRQLPIALRLAGRGFGRVVTANSSLAAARPDEPHWYLAELATDPPLQGLGLGGRLVRHGLARCDRDGVPGYLEAVEHNVPYYERFGFAVTRTIEFRSGPTVFGMLRQPS